MTHAPVTTTLALAAGFLGVLAVGFFTGFANTWPVIVYALVSTFLLSCR